MAQAVVLDWSWLFSSSFSCSAEYESHGFSFEPAGGKHCLRPATKPRRVDWMEINPFSSHYAKVSSVSAIRQPVSGSTTCPCPICGEQSLIKIHRRLIDRLLSLFVELQRYRCNAFNCQWKGNLSNQRIRKSVAAAKNRTTL